MLVAHAPFNSSYQDRVQNPKIQDLLKILCEVWPLTLPFFTGTYVLATRQSFLCCYLSISLLYPRSQYMQIRHFNVHCMVSYRVLVSEQLTSTKRWEVGYRCVLLILQIAILQLTNNKVRVCLYAITLWIKWCEYLSCTSVVPAVSKGCAFISSETEVLKKSGLLLWIVYCRKCIPSELWDLGVGWGFCFVF